MHSTEYGIGRVVDAPFEDVVTRVKDVLKSEGFGVLTEVDVQAALREKLDVERGKYVILGACSPRHAHAALEAEPELGLFLPCNLIVYETGEGTRVSAIDAQAMLGMVGNPALDEIAADVKARLARVVDAL